MKKLTKKTRILIRSAIILCVLAWLVWGNLSLEVTEYTVSSQKLPESFDGFRIVQISDLHNAEFGEGNHRLLSEIRALQPDIIVITGDLVDRRRTDMDIAVAFVEAAVKIAPTYYVPGNHEKNLSNLQELYDRLSHAGAQLLTEKKVLIQRGEQAIRLVGIADYSFYTEEGYPKVLNKLIPNDEIYTVLLSHRPKQFDLYVDSGTDLVLVGHIHGAQFRLPFLGGIFSFDEGFFPKHDDGVHTEGSTTMVVSRGLGQTIIPIRICNRPEIVAVTLEKAK